MTGSRPLLFGELLRRYRHAADLTQEALAERSGLSVRGISDLERGARKVPHPSTIRMLAGALGLAPADRIGLEAAARRHLAPTADNPTRRSPPHNLPAAFTSFIGRQREVTEVRRLLSTTRLLTLTGAGGCGKTRLSLEVARTMTSNEVDSLWLIELGALTDPWLLPQAIATAIGIRERPNQSLTAMLAQELCDRRLLLVLDNCEHLAGPCAELASILLRACPGLRILATSRIPLGLAGETAWQVPSLSLPTAAPNNGAISSSDQHHASAYAEAAASEAVQLFCARAAEALPGFTLTEANAAATSTICTQLDGLPLALELAAPWVRVLSLEEFAARLAAGFHLLAATTSSVPPRHRTLQATLEWSYALLSELERRLLHRLAIFAGSFALAATEAIAADQDMAPEAILPLLARLVDASLVIAQPEFGRYRLLKPVRSDALQRLAARGELDLVGDRHAAYYRDRALDALPALWDSHQDRDRWFTELDLDLDNIRAAWRWADETDEVETSLWFGGALQPYFNVRGLLSEARERLAAALAKPGAEHTPARAWALLAEASLARSAEDYEAAHQAAAASVALFRQLNDPHGLIHALIILGTAHAWSEDAAAARVPLEEALVLSHTAAFGPGVGLPLFQLGVLALIEGDYTCAEALLGESLTALRGRNDSYRAAHLLFALGFTALAQNELVKADTQFRESLVLATERGDRWAQAFVLEGFACLKASQGEAEQALRLAGAAEGLRERHNLHVSIHAFRRLRDHLLASAWATLAPAAADAAWRTGRAEPLNNLLIELRTADSRSS